MTTLSVCPNTSRFNCEDSSNVCNASYCDFHNSFCPEGYYLACFDRTDTAGYQQMLSTDIQSCADQCSADANCTRFEYNDGVWNLSKECWLSNDYPRSTDTFWLHNNQPGETVQTNCYKKCSPSNLTGSGDYIRQDVLEYLNKEIKKYPGVKYFTVENGVIGKNSSNKWVFDFDGSNNTNTKRRFVMKREHTCTRCTAGKKLTWMVSNGKDGVKCGNCHTDADKLRKRKTGMNKRKTRRETLRTRLDNRIKIISDKNNDREDRITALTSKGGQQAKIAKLRTRIAKAESRIRRKQEKRDRANDRVNEIAQNLIKVDQMIDYIEKRRSTKPDIC